jgi:hypothetical protein
MAKSFRIQLDELDYNLKNFDPRAKRAIKATMDFQAAKSETRMRSNAPWTDRTTNARNGLFATVIENSPTAWMLLLSHSVAYGIWLEVIENGKYAAVRPEWLRAQRELMQRLSRVFERMEKGRGR